MPWSKYKANPVAPPLVIPGVEIRVVVGYSDYRVSGDGRVWSWFRLCYWKELNRFIQKGYMAVGLTRDGVRRQRLVHQLVLEAFVGPCPCGMEACHFPDRDRTNNKLSNLRWDTKKANSLDAKAHGTWTHGSKTGTAKLYRDEIQGFKDRHASGESILSIANSRGVNWGTIKNAVTGKWWKDA